MLRRCGEEYQRYLDRVPMFLPGEPGGRLFAGLFGRTGPRRWTLAATYASILVLGTAGAFGLRAYSLSRVPVVRYSDTLSAASLSPASAADVERTLAAALASPEVGALLSKFHRQPGHALVAYIVPRAYMMQHLIADVGEHEAHHGKREEKGFKAMARHLGEMYALKPLRQLREGAGSPEKRIIFTEALTARGSSVPASRALDADVLRFPLFLAELDGDTVVLTMETPRRHSWGTIPMPAF